MIDSSLMQGWKYEIKKREEKAEKLAEAKAAATDIVLREAEVIEMGVEIPVSNLSGRSHLGILAKYAVEHGWVIRAGQSRYRTADRMYKGEVKEGEVKTHQWLQGHRNGHHFTVSTALKLFDGWPIADIAEMKVGLYEYGKECDRDPAPGD